MATVIGGKTFTDLVDISATAVGILGVISLVSIVFSPTNIKICTSDDVCRIFTKSQYETERNDLATKYENNTPVSYQEYRTFIAMLDQEIKKRGSVAFADVTDNDVLRKKIANFLRTNP